MREKISSNVKKTLRDKQIADMPQLSQKKCEEMRTLLSNDYGCLLESRFELGRHVYELANHPDKYGKRSIQTIALALGCSRDVLDDAKHLHEVWTSSADQKTLMDERDDVRQMPMGLRHAVEIAKISLYIAGEQTQTVKQARKTWVNLWKNDGLTVRELRNHPQRPDKAQRTEPTPTTPPSVKSFIRSITSNAQIATQNVMKVEERLAHLIDNDADATTSDCLAQLEEALDAMEQQRVAIVEQLESVQRRINRLRDEIDFADTQKSDRSENVVADSKGVKS